MPKKQPIWSPISLGRPINKLASGGVSYAEPRQKSLVSSVQDDIAKEVFESFQFLEKHFRNKKQNLSLKSKGKIKGIKLIKGRYRNYDLYIKKLEDTIDNIISTRPAHIEFTLGLVRDNLEYLRKKCTIPEEVMTSLGSALSTLQAAYMATR